MSWQTKHQAPKSHPLGLAFLTSMLKTALNTNIIQHIWKLANIASIQKHKQRHMQGHFIHVHIPPLSNCKDIGEEPSSLYNGKHTKHTHSKHTRSKHTRSKWVHPNGFPCATNHCNTWYEQSFRHHKHTRTNQKAPTDQYLRHNH